MGIGGWAQLALGLVQLLNWVTTKVDQKDWKNQGWLEAYAAAMKLVNARVERMTKIAEVNHSITDEDLDAKL